MTDVVVRARAWRDDDPDPATRAEVDALLAADDRSELASCFDGRLEFGTAGLRGRVGPGPNRMNRATVARATRGLVDHLDAEETDGPLVVGRDARNGSADFLDETVAVAAGAGREVIVLPEPCPTPLCAFAVLELGAAAGVQITASHNPPTDNGYKVYLADGAQIVSPVDDAIAARIEAVESVSRLPRDRSGDQESPVDLVDTYVDRVVGALAVGGARSVRAAYTPLHGVGGELALRAFARAGFPEPSVVTEQFAPDPDFPTVAFPNPEEPGAMDLVVALAEREGLALAMAHDPDADRLGVAVPATDGWRRLRGDEIGVLLADHLITHRMVVDPIVATTVVSSRMLFELARARGVRAVETLTGFKWVARAADDLLFGYEEALGYAVTSAVRDKDGISAALVLCETASVLAGDGRTLLGRLDELAAELGVHETDQVVLRADGSSGLDELAGRIDALRSRPPDRLGSMPVRFVEDLQTGDRLPPTNALVLAVDGARVVLRPSGTEPKLKCYLEATEAANEDVPAARARARSRLRELREAIEAVFDP